MAARAYLQFFGQDTTAEIVCEPCWREAGRYAYGRSTQFLGDDVPAEWVCACRGGRAYMVTLTADRYHYDGQPSQQVMAAAGPDGCP